MRTVPLNILFVDDEQRILDGLSRQLRSKRELWNIRFATSGRAALKMLAESPADIVISDMRMPGMNGGELLQEVSRLYPDAIRIVLSGQTDMANLFANIGSIHQYLQKPCETPRLVNAIERTGVLSSRLTQSLLRAAVHQIKSLPPATENYHALTKELVKEDASISTIAEIVSQDPALSVKLMQLVNSAFFAVSLRIANPFAAVVLLGVKTLHAIVVANPLFEFSCVNGNELPGLSALWKSSFEIGKAAGQLARSDGASEIVQEQSRLAGLLSSIGRGILLTSYPAAYAGLVADCQANPKTLRQREIDFFGASQDEVTAYAIGLWSFADEVVDAVAYQSAPSRMPAIIRQHPATYLHIARNVRTVSTNPLEEADGLDQPFIERLNLHALVPRRSRYAA